jgi:hypothetical protein
MKAAPSYLFGKNFNKPSLAYTSVTSNIEMSKSLEIPRDIAWKSRVQNLTYRFSIRQTVKTAVVWPYLLPMRSLSAVSSPSNHAFAILSRA